MRPLTDTTPKPLLAVQGRPLLEWHLQALAQAKKLLEDKVAPELKTMVGFSESDGD